MLSLQWPWMLIFLPLPWLYRVWRRPAVSTSAALRTSLFSAIGNEKQTGVGHNSWHWFANGLLALIWISTLLAVCRPTWIGDPVALPTTGRDLLLAVDISESMKVEDMRAGDALVNRLAVVKAVVGNFVQKRRGDRLGLILFGTRAYLQTPLTFDLYTLNTLLQEARIGFAGGSTAIGDAIGLAVKRLQSRPEAERVLVLLSDGADTASEVPPLQAARLAAANSIKVYTIGIGADEILRQSIFGLRHYNPSADLDEESLIEIATMTGGRYFRARNPDELAQVYDVIDRLEPVEQDAETLRPTKALFYWPLAVALAASMVLMCLHGATGRVSLSSAGSGRPPGTTAGVARQ